MNIQCPNCQTSYMVPDEKIGDKPKKMRCARCKNVFSVKRRTEQTPDGYEEFTGPQKALPQEFAFLKETLPPQDPAPAAQDDIEERVTLAREIPALPVETAEEVPTKAEEAHEDSATEPPPRDSGEVPHFKAPPPASGRLTSSRPPRPSQTPQPSPSPAPTSGPQKAVVPASSSLGPAARPTPPLRGAKVAAAQGNGSWETEAPLELGRYTLQSITPPAIVQLYGKIVAIGTGVLFLFVMFIIGRNGWEISLSEFPAQVAFAFSGEARERLPDAVKTMEATVESRYILTAGSHTLLVVNGQVFNNSAIRRSAVVIRGRLRDVSGDIRAETRAPCGTVISNENLKQIPPGRSAQIYRRGGEMIDCTVAGESSTAYQMVFEDAPADYDESFAVEVTPINAR